MQTGWSHAVIVTTVPTTMAPGADANESDHNNCGASGNEKSPPRPQLPLLARNAEGSAIAVGV
jgi:hypothetical protein